MSKSVLIVGLYSAVYISKTRKEKFLGCGENCQRNVTDLAGSLVTSCRPPGRLQKKPDDRTWNAGVAVRTADGSRRTADAVTIREIAASACRTPISAGAEGDSRHFRTYAFDSSFTRPQRWTWVQFARLSSTQPTFLTTQPNPSKQNRCSATLSNSIMPTTERKCAENYNK